MFPRSQLVQFMCTPGARLSPKHDLSMAMEFLLKLHDHAQSARLQAIVGTDGQSESTGMKLYWVEKSKLKEARR